ncbi:hypothetical protein GQ43DRAFT_44991 [Delitschia confertaspora ATCC 74209]|uniref:Uncharacterized protein n=1 Tax=Delitschia confertaspora ATCC 74209 TaxID=1513339 RepID=A0A9P4JL90_9PLEO|nr:hypothetical protein GQ43DRAFT_44991 [Delitschia confertaspora ATCC 74209]
MQSEQDLPHLPSVPMHKTSEATPAVVDKNAGETVELTSVMQESEVTRHEVGKVVEPVRLDKVVVEKCVETRSSKKEETKGKGESKEVDIMEDCSMEDCLAMPEPRLPQINEESGDIKNGVDGMVQVEQPVGLTEWVGTRNSKNKRKKVKKERNVEVTAAESPFVDEEEMREQELVVSSGKRRVPSVSTPESSPEGKRMHISDDKWTVVQEASYRESAPEPPLFSLGVRPEPTIRDSGYHDGDFGPIVPQEVKELQREMAISKDMVITPSEDKGLEESTRDSLRVQTPTPPGSPSLPTGSPRYLISPSAVDSATKERASYLFDSSPSTRAHIDQVPYESPLSDSPSVSRQRHVPSITSPLRSSVDLYTDVPSPPKEIVESLTETTPQDQMHPSKARTPALPPMEGIHKQPYQPLFGDPEKSTAHVTPSKNVVPATPQLDTIKEASPDDSHLKKTRLISDVGAPERGVKSAKRSPSTKSFHERVTSPMPRTPTPAGRKRISAEIVDISPPSPSDPVKQKELRSSSAVSVLSDGGRHRTPDPYLRSVSAASNRSITSHRSATPPLRRMGRSVSGDLRAAARLDGSAREVELKVPAMPAPPALSAQSRPSTPSTLSRVYDPVRGKGKARAVDMPDVFEAYGEAQGSPMSPTRPPSVRKRQSMQIMDLQSQLDALASHNKSLEEARTKAEEAIQSAKYQHQVDEQHIAEVIAARDREVHQKDIDIAQLRDTLRALQQEVTRLTELNHALTDANNHLTTDTNERYAQLQAEGAEAYRQWQEASKALEELRAQYTQLTTGMEEVVRQEIALALDDRNAEIKRLNAELANTTEQIKTLQRQIFATKKGDSFLIVRDEDYFDSACQQLCQHVQQWVLRFSKFSDTRACRLSSEVASDPKIDTATREKIETRLDNAVLDGSDVDMLLADRVKRRDVFMSVVMTMIWEYVFTRYLFGMDREQRQKLKSLEKTLSEVGPTKAVAQWRAITLTLLSKRDAFVQQRAQDTEAVVHEIYSTLSTLLPPPSHLQKQILESLRNVMRLAVELSIEMRTQRAEYIMLPPLQPEYDTNGDLVAKVTFNASLMNERSGETDSNDELEARGAVVKIVLFPLVVKKGDDFGEGEDEIVVCPAQVLVVKPAANKKVVRVLSGAMDIDSRHGRSVASLVPPESSVMDYGSNVI